MGRLKQVFLDAWEVGLQHFKINLVDFDKGRNWKKFHGSQFSWVNSFILWCGSNFISINFQVNKHNNINVLPSVGKKVFWNPSFRLQVTQVGKKNVSF
jgi:hypothetical protein